MKPAFLLLPLALGLGACAQAIMTADASPCDKPAEAYRIGGSAVMLGAGNNLMLATFANDNREASRIPRPAATTDCARRNPAPRTYDLHRLGDEPALPGILVGANPAGPSCAKARGA